MSPLATLALKPYVVGDTGLETGCRAYFADRCSFAQSYRFGGASPFCVAPGDICDLAMCRGRRRVENRVGEVKARGGGGGGHTIEGKVP